MTPGAVQPRKILVVADPGADQIALESAAELARRQGASLNVAACVEPPHDLAILARLAGQNTGQILEEAVERTREAVNETLARMLPERPVEVAVLVGKAYLQIVRHVAETGCDFVVKTAEPLSGMQRFLFASTDQHLLRKCPCPVWLQTPGATTRPKRVLAAVDLDLSDADEPRTLAGLNRRVVETARMIAGAHGAEVVVLHAWDAPGAGMVWAFSDGRDARLSADLYVNEILGARQEAMETFLAQMRESADTQPRLVPHLVQGAPERVIHEQARATRADLVVMGTVARTRLSGVFIGNTAENIINSLECPVLAVKPDGFVSPLLRR